MSEPFVAEIKIFAGNFAPRGWAFCGGQLLPVGQNTALFSLIGTTYGGDGRTTMGLPNLQERAPMHPGRGPGLTGRKLGSKSGGEKVTLTTNQLASHTHDWNANTAAATGTDPQGKVTADSSPIRIYEPGTPNADMGASEIADTGGGQPHDNLMPALCINFIIALFGIYPSRN